MAIFLPSIRAYCKPLNIKKHFGHYWITFTSLTMLRFLLSKNDEITKINLWYGWGIQSFRILSFRTQVWVSSYPSHWSNIKSIGLKRSSLTGVRRRVRQTWLIPETCCREVFKLLASHTPWGDANRLNCKYPGESPTFS